MKRIVDAAIPVLTPLDFGYWGMISLEDQQKLASWITLFTMSFEFSDKETVCVSDDERNLFRESGIPTNHWNIAIGYGEPTAGVERTKHCAISLHPSNHWNGHRKSQITAFFFGRLIALSYYSEIPYFDSFEPFARRHGLEPIWPPRDNDLRKPFRIHYDEAVEGLVADLSAALSG
jgi:hypothetical protein